MTKTYHEDAESIALWNWAMHYKILRDHLIHIPNGGKRNRREAARLKRMGVRAGVHDYLLPVPRGLFHGLWVELKATPPNDARVTETQKDWKSKMRAQGYAAYICKGWETAASVMRWYVSLPSPKHDYIHPPLAVILEDLCLEYGVGHNIP